MADLDKLTVLGAGGLRAFIVKNKIVVNKIAKAKRAELVNAIVKSDWWKDNGTPVSNSTEEKKDKEEKNKDKEEKNKDKEEKEAASAETQKSILIGEVEKCINEKNDLRKEIRDLGKRIKDKDLTIHIGEKVAEKEKEKKIRNEKKKVKKESKREELQAELDAKINEIETITKANNINIDKEDLILKQMREDVYSLPQLDEPVNEIPLSHIPHQDGLISHKEESKRNVDVGHSVINVYCGGNSNPNFPIPQEVVRQALNMNNLPIYQQQEIGDMIMKEVAGLNLAQNNKAPPYIQNQYFQQPAPQQQFIPQPQPQYIPPPQPQPQYIPAPQAPPQAPQFIPAPQAPQFIPPPQAPKPTAKKFPEVKTVKPLEKRPERKQQDDDDEEDEVDKEERLEREEIERLNTLKAERIAEAQSGSNKGFNPKFMKRLEQKLAGGAK